MNAEDYKKAIIKMIEDLGEEDKRFLVQLYTIIMQRENKRRGH